MKKVIAILLIIAFAFMATSCSKKARDDSSASGFFVEITSYQSSFGSHTTFVYDPFTKIVYLYISGAYHVGLSPYYTVKYGEPVIAQYGVNWTEADLIR